MNLRTSPVSARIRAADSTAGAGASLQLNVTAPQTLAYDLTVYAPDGSTLTSVVSRGSVNQPVPALPAAGSYTVVLAPCSVQPVPSRCR